MTREHETSVLALLLVLAAALYAVTWSIAGRSAYLEAPAAVSAVEHAPRPKAPPGPPARSLRPGEVTGASAASASNDQEQEGGAEAPGAVDRRGDDQGEPVGAIREEPASAAAIAHAAAVGRTAPIRVAAAQ